MQKWKVECRRSLRRSGRRPVLRNSFSGSAVCGLWESNTEYSDTSVDHVVQDFFHNVTALESDCGGDDSDVRRHLSTLTVSGSVSGYGREQAPGAASAARKKPSRQKRKKRRVKRKWLAAAQALNDQPGGLRSKRLKDLSPIARPRRELGETGVIGARIGATFTSSEDETCLARLFATTNEACGHGLVSASRGAGDEVSSSVCVTESELSDTPWEESCDADDELSCFEAPKLHTCSMSSAVCYGDVEDEGETGTSDPDHWIEAERRQAIGSTAVMRRAFRRAVQTSARHVSINSPVVAGTANSFAQINRLLTQFVSGEKARERNLRLPPMNRPARRVVWRLATLYKLQCSTERVGRLQCLLLSRTSASHVPDQANVEQLWQRASLSCPIPTEAPIRQSCLTGPMESEEMLEQSSDSVSTPQLPWLPQHA